MYCILQGILLVGVSEKVPPKVHFRAPKKCPKMLPKELQNGGQNGPRKAARGSPKTIWGPCTVPGAPAGSRALLHKAFFCCWVWLCSYLFFGFGFGFFMCVVVVVSFFRSWCMSLCVLVFVLYVLFPVVVFLFYAFVFCDVRRLPYRFWSHLKETCNMFQDVSEWFSGDADSFGMRWVCASRDGSLIGGLES